MAQPISNQFTSWKLSPEEELEGCMLNAGQVMVIQNDMANAAMQLINLDFTPDDPKDYLMKKAYLDAQVRTYQTMLDRSEKAVEALRKLAELQAHGLSAEDLSSLNLS